jgi:hypothetical protein
LDSLSTSKRSDPSLSPPIVEHWVASVHYRILPIARGA